jgi:hypothetical protein
MHISAGLLTIERRAYFVMNVWTSSLCDKAKASRLVTAAVVTYIESYTLYTVALKGPEHHTVVITPRLS